MIPPINSRVMVASVVGPCQWLRGRHGTVIELALNCVDANGSPMPGCFVKLDNYRTDCVWFGEDELKQLSLLEIIAETAVD